MVRQRSKVEVADGRWTVAWRPRLAHAILGPTSHTARCLLVHALTEHYSRRR